MRESFVLLSKAISKKVAFSLENVHVDSLKLSHSAHFSVETTSSIALMLAFKALFAFKPNECTQRERSRWVSSSCKSARKPVLPQSDTAR